MLKSWFEIGVMRSDLAARRGLICSVSFLLSIVRHEGHLAANADGLIDSGHGTNAKCRPALKLSAFRDRPEARGQNDEFDPKQTQAVLKSLFSVNRPDRAAYTNTDRYKRPLQIVHLTQGRPIRLENIFGASAVFTRRSTGALRIGR